MRIMSFWHTREQMYDRSKTVTRRNGWLGLKAGDVVLAVEKARAVPVAERVVLYPIRVLSVRRERLDAITPEDVVREGFPDMTPAEFVAFYGKAMNRKPDELVTRIAFECAHPAPEGV